MDKAKKAVEEFHHCNPQRPSAIHSVTTPLSDPRLYNEVTDTPGEGFITPPLKSTSDVIYPLHTKLVDDLIHTRTLPTSLLACIPAATNRVWIYEAGLMDAVTFSAFAVVYVFPTSSARIVRLLGEPAIMAMSSCMVPQLKVLLPFIQVLEFV